MKTILAIILTTFLVISCKQVKVEEKQISLVQIVDLQNHVNRLSQINPPRNYNNIQSLNDAANYIFQEFSVAGCRVTKQTYTTDSDMVYTNVIAEINPNADTTYVIGAHYDVCGDNKGADDNASGVAGLIELAKLFRMHEKQIPFNIQLVAYSTEEPPYFGTRYMGSYVHAKSLKDQNKKVTLMISLEMIGYFTEKEKSQKFPSAFLKPFYPSVGNFIAIASTYDNNDHVKEIKQVMLEKTKVPCEALAAPVLVTGVDFSDHRNYWKFDYPAVMITDTAFYRNPNYHTKDDLPSTLNYAKMAEVVKGVFYFILKKAEQK